MKVKMHDSHRSHSTTMLMTSEGMKENERRKKIKKIAILGIKTNASFHSAFTADKTATRRL